LKIENDGYIMGAEYLDQLEKRVSYCCKRIENMKYSGYKINVDKFRTFALQIAVDLTRTYSWYYLPPTVHKILIHGPSIIENALVSIRELSEEAAEARNKDITSNK